MLMNDDDFYIVHHEKKKIVERIPYSTARSGSGHSDERNPHLKSAIDHANSKHGPGHTVMQGGDLKHKKDYKGINESTMENIYNQSPFSFPSASAGFAPKAPVLTESTEVVAEDKHDDGTPKSKGNAFDFKSFVSKKKEEAGENLRNHEKKKTETGAVYKRKEDAKVEDDSDTKGNSGEKRGRGRPAGKYGSYKKKIKEALEAYSLGQLDEISKATLGKYINKAHLKGGISSMRYMDAKPGSESEKKHLRQSSNRDKGIAKAVTRLTKEDLDAMSQDEFDSLIEDFEQLDELSKKTLSSYVSKTASNLPIHGIHRQAAKTDKDYTKSNRKWTNGVNGINAAVRKLAKEPKGE